MLKESASYLERSRALLLSPLGLWGHNPGTRSNVHLPAWLAPCVPLSPNVVVATPVRLRRSRANTASPAQESVLLDAVSSPQRALRVPDLAVVGVRGQRRVIGGLAVSDVVVGKHFLGVVKERNGDMLFWLPSDVEFRKAG